MVSADDIVRSQRCNDKRLSTDKDSGLQALPVERGDKDSLDVKVFELLCYSTCLHCQKV